MESKWRLFQKSFALEKKDAGIFTYISTSVRRDFFDEILPGINYPHWFQSAVCWQFSHLNLLLFLHRHFRWNIWEKLILLWNIAETSMKFPEKRKPPVILSDSSRFSEENYAQICQDTSLPSKSQFSFWPQNFLIKYFQGQIIHFNCYSFCFCMSKVIICVLYSH